MKTAQDILNFTRSNCGITGFTSHSCNPKYNAQRNLAGRTHYADDDTLAFFKARILSARDEANGLLFILLESVSGISKDARKTKRAVIFDVFGTVVNDRDGENAWHATSNKARKGAMEFVESFDAVSHTLAELERKAKRLEEESSAIRSFLA